MFMWSTLNSWFGPVGPRGKFMLNCWKGKGTNGIPKEA